jgi:hypothetical protein
MGTGSSSVSQRHHRIGTHLWLPVRILAAEHSNHTVTESSETATNGTQDIHVAPCLTQIPTSGLSSHLSRAAVI